MLGHPESANLELDKSVIDAIKGSLLHLIRNSLEALEEWPDPIIQISTVSEEREGSNQVRIVVEDNGPGFDTGDISQVFDPYVTTKPKGTGLGLAVVKKLVEEHVGPLRESLGANPITRGAAIDHDAPPEDRQLERQGVGMGMTRQIVGADRGHIEQTDHRARIEAHVARRL